MAERHEGGAIFLSIGTPVDSTPAIIQQALSDASDAPGYPTTHGSTQFREAVVAWFARRRSVPGLSPLAVLPTLGSKELVGLLPGLLGIGEGDVVVIPRVAYPTYAVGTTLAGATVLEADDVDEWAGRRDVKLVWLNSPSNPTGAVASRLSLAGAVVAAREIGAVVASDECYAELPWDQPWASEGVPSALDPIVSGGSTERILVASSLSKRSNLAGYRAAFVAGDPSLIASLLDVRKHIGAIMPAPVQAAATVALLDDSHVDEQRERYRARRTVLLAALAGASFRVDHSHAGLYLWATRDEDCWETVAWFAERGILVAPGSFYGASGSRHVRIALTAPDAEVESAARRMA